jgi:large subunit ribosomal protein L3
MGGKRVKVVNLQILKIILEKNLVVVKGAIPGPSGAYVIIERWK